MNCLTKTLTALFPVIALLPLSGCASRPDTTLNPPASSDLVTVMVKLPPETEALPLDVLYRSETCRKEVYDNTSASHVTTVRGVNPQLVSLSQADSNGRREAKIAMNGGGKCDWKLSGIRVGIQLSKTSALADGKNVTAANYVFDFDDDGYRNAFGEGEPKKVNGDLQFETKFYPMIVINNMFHEVYAQLFAGDTGYEKWSRYYRLYGTRHISIEPILYTQKVVNLESPKSRKESPGMTVLYPDGTTEKVDDIYPNYDRLLRIK